MPETMCVLRALMNAAAVLAVTAAADVHTTFDRESCVGYFVSGAGTADVNGCYKEVPGGLCGGSLGFERDSLHQLYSWYGKWHFGVCGHVKTVTYETRPYFIWPPQAEGGCGSVWNTTSVGEPPCPIVQRSGLPPLPKPPAPAPPAPPMRLVVDEHFDGTEINTSLWNIIEDEPAYVKENVRVENGSLVLRTVAQNLTVKGKKYFVTGGSVNTAGKLDQRLGRWEASVKLPRIADSSGYNLHSSIWFTSTQPKVNVTIPNISGCAQEIDLVEQYVGGNAPESTVLAHVDAFKGTERTGCKGGWLTSPTTFGKTADFTTYWTTFRMDWTENWITMSINDTVYASFTADSGGGDRIKDIKDKMWMKLTAHPLYPYLLNPNDVFPLEFLIDWVRIYEWIGPTPQALFV